MYRSAPSRNQAITEPYFNTRDNSSLNPHRHKGGWCNPLRFFANNSRKKRSIAAKLSVSLYYSILHLFWKLDDPEPDYLWPVSFFSKPCLAGIPTRRTSAHILAVRLQSFRGFKHSNMWCDDVSLMHSVACQAHLKVRSGHWPFMTSVYFFDSYMFLCYFL